MTMSVACYEEVTIERNVYDGSEVTCYDVLLLTKRNFHDLCSTMLREKYGPKDSIHVTLEQKFVMFLLVVENGFKMRLLCST